MTRNLLFVLTLSILPACAADVAGVWKLEGDVAGVHINRICTIKQTDSKITGGCKNPANELALTGEVNGNNVTWSYSTDYEGAKVTLLFKGTVEAGASMTGKIEVTGASGDFSAKKQ